MTQILQDPDFLTEYEDVIEMTYNKARMMAIMEDSDKNTPSGELKSPPQELEGTSSIVPANDIRIKELIASTSAVSQIGHSKEQDSLHKPPSPQSKVPPGDPLVPRGASVISPKERLTSAVPEDSNSLGESSGSRAVTHPLLSKEKESHTTADPNSQVNVLEASRPAPQLRRPLRGKAAQPQRTLATWLRQKNLSNRPPAEASESTTEHSKGSDGSPTSAVRDFGAEREVETLADYRSRVMSQAAAPAARSHWTGTLANRPNSNMNGKGDN